MRFGIHILSRSGRPESLGSRPIGFDFRHLDGTSSFSYCLQNRKREYDGSPSHATRQYINRRQSSPTGLNFSYVPMKTDFFDRSKLEKR